MLLALQHCVTQLGVDKTYWVALSGGVDSHVLLTLCCELRKQYAFTLNAIYINHGLNPRANEWGLHCQQVCEANAVNFIQRSIQVNVSGGHGVEEVARKERYAVLAEYIGEHDVLLTAHHQDDQAETVLLQLARGAGLKGLSAMPLIKPFARGQHARPLLTFSRQQIEQFARAHQLKWIEDDSNRLTTILRNFIRHDVFPLLKKRWPAINTTFSRSAAHCAEAAALLQEYALQDLQQAVGSRENTLSVRALLRLSPARARQVLRMWIEKQGFLLPDSKKIATIQANVLTAAWDRLPCVKWQKAVLRRYRDDLFLTSPLPLIDPSQTFTWKIAEPLLLPGVGTLCATPAFGVGLRAEMKEVTVRFRQGGEYIQLPRRGCHTLKNLFQEWEVLPWLRDRVPLVFLGDRLIAIVGYAIDEDYSAQKDEPGLELIIRQ